MACTFSGKVYGQFNCVFFKFQAQIIITYRRDGRNLPLAIFPLKKCESLSRQPSTSLPPNLGRYSQIAPFKDLDLEAPLGKMPKRVTKGYICTHIRKRSLQMHPARKLRLSHYYLLPCIHHHSHPHFWGDDWLCIIRFGPARPIR
jgi:hypothetical protein